MWHFVQTEGKRTRGADAPLFVFALSASRQRQPELIGFARLPWETFADRSPSGSFDRQGIRQSTAFPVHE
jgi:hypothetical protein